MRESRYNIWLQREDGDYVFNAMSGSLLRITKAHHEAFERFLANGSTDCPPQVLGNLVAGRMLIGDDTNELDLLSQRYSSGRHDTSHFALTVVTSLGCNFDCPYCFEDKHPSIMDKHVQEAVLRVLEARLPHTKSFHVTWFGGEPLVGKRSLYQLSDAFIRRCDDSQVAYSSDIITNGYLLDAETCAGLSSRGVKSAQVGLDGPPDIHDKMRPQANGKGSFWTIVRNLHNAIRHMSVSVRVNVDLHNAKRVKELFEILVAEGFRDKLHVYPAQLVGVESNPSAPSARYSGCYSRPEFARFERDFLGMATEFGLSSPNLPRPTGAPCTAVRSNELIVGSSGELYKCWNNVGDKQECVGHISDYQNLNGRLAKWLTYSPFENSECRTCVALPVCMGGCAQHAFSSLQYENRCGTFRHTYLEQIADFIDFAQAHEMNGLTSVSQLARRMETR